MLNKDRLARVEGSHWISPLNFDPEVLAGYDFPSPLGLIDSTLRKVRYSAGAATSIDGLLRIAAELDALGVRDESLNLDWYGDATPNPRELELVREVLAGDFGFVTNVYADTLLGNGAVDPVVDPRSTVDLLAGMGAAVMAPGVVPAPDAEAEARQLDQLAEIVEYGASVGLEFTITLAQCGRRDFDALIRVANAALALGARRIDLLDSTSSLGPEAMRVFLRRFRAGLVRPTPITMHPHDDFGMATASAVAAATAGAGPDVSMNGVSYRCGFAALEEVVLSLEVLYGVDTGIDVGRMQHVSDVVAREMDMPVAQFKPVTGGYAYLKNTCGDVLACLRDGPGSFPPISGCVSAAVTGAEVRWVWDRLSTRNMARQLAANLGLDPSEDEVDLVRATLDAAVEAKDSYPRWLTATEAEELCRRVVLEHRDESLAS